MLGYIYILAKGFPIAVTDVEPRPLQSKKKGGKLVNSYSEERETPLK